MMLMLMMKRHCGGQWLLIRQEIDAHSCVTRPQLD